MSTATASMRFKEAKEISLTWSSADPPKFARHRKGIAMRP